MRHQQVGRDRIARQSEGNAFVGMRAAHSVRASYASSEPP